MADPTLYTAILGRQQPRPGQLTQGRADTRQLLMRAKGWVHRCATINSDTAASIPFQLMSSRTSASTAKQLGLGRPASSMTKAFASGRGDIQPSSSVKAAIRGRVDDLAVIDTHPVLELLQDINAWSDGYAWRFGVYYDLHLWGRSFVHMLGTPTPSELWRMLPHITKVLPDQSDFVGAFLYGDGRDEQRYSPDEVLWFRLYDPQDPWGGLGPVEAWLKTVDASDMIEAFRHDLFQRGGSPDWVLQNANMRTEQKRAFRKDWRRLFGKLFRRQENIAIMEGEGELHRLSDSPRDLEFQGGADQVRDMIASALGTPKSLLTSDDVNRANARESDNAFLKYTIWPMVQRFEDTINEQLVSRYGPGLFIMHDSPVKEDQMVRIEERKSKLASGWSINEVRAEDGDEPIGPDGDEYLVADGLKKLSDLITPPEPPAPAPMPAPAGEAQPEKPAAEEPPSPAKKDKAFHDVSVSDVHCCSKRLHEPIASEAGTVAPKAVAAVKSALDDYASTIVSRMKRFGRWGRLPFEFVVTPEEADEFALRVTMSLRPELAAAAKEAGAAALKDLNISRSFTLETSRLQDAIRDQSWTAGRNVAKRYVGDISGEILEGLKANETTPELVERVTRKFQTENEWQALRLVKTETQFAATSGLIEGWKQSGVVVGKQWVVSPDPCPICVAVGKKFGTGRAMVANSRSSIKASATLGLDDAFFKQGDAIPYEVQLASGETVERTAVIDYVDLHGPPVHPNCRCSLRAVLADEIELPEEPDS
jgi:HK97 family phage portal protein